MSDDQPLVVHTRRPRPRAERMARDLASATLFRSSLHAGPAAVAASLRRGLRDVGAPVYWNPPRVQPGAVVAVLSDAEALRAAVAWRREGRIRRLLAGPNIVVTPQDEAGLIAAPEVDVCVVPSAWVADLYLQREPSLAGRIGIWPAGVDAHAFRPPPGPRERHALVYRKQLPGQRNVPDAEFDEIRATLRETGWKVTSVTYGSHTRRAYQRLLGRASLLVAFSPSESQGIALQEAWAADLPTLVWDAGTLVLDGEVVPASSAPYLSPRTGAAFTTPAAFRDRLRELEDGSLEPDPRAWVLEHGTNEASARGFLALARGGRIPEPDEAPS